jgi:hypothetical protein
MNTDSTSPLCRAHLVAGCGVCTVDDLHAALDELHAKRQRIKAERRAMTVGERFDLGGEG